MLRLQQDIKQQVDQKMTNQKRTYFLQEQLKSIKKELGLERDDKEAILNKFRERRKKIKVPPTRPMIFSAVAFTHVTLCMRAIQIYSLGV